MTPSVSHVSHRAPSPHLLALGILIALAPPAMAQSTGVTASEASDLDTVTVTGIRGSLQSSMNLKRDTVGVLDGIIAEDIGKFPDTNLAESMQRISGVSIDRTLSGEGSRVTVRGIGADFNQVLLNGRQMPASNLGPGGSGISGSRAFDFSNLASEAVSALEVYKTARADAPTGGIGATINVKTARPFSSPGLTASVGIKGVMDRSVDNLPRSYPGKSLTPEISGIFSNTFAGGRFGVSANFSYQERDSAYSQARANQGWDVFRRGDDAGIIGRLPVPGDIDYDLYDVTNPPKAGDLYARPRNFQYLVSSVQRQRRNGQITFQYAPTDNITATLDYTYADNRVQQQRNELQVTLNPHGPGASTWTDGPISAPTIYTQYGQASGVPRDLQLAMAQVFNRSELESVGLNLEWAVTDALDLQFDYHNSTAEARPDSPQGGANFLVTVAPVLERTTVDFSNPLPILSVELAPGINQLGPEHATLGLTGFRSSFNWSEVEQFQASGTFRFADYQAIDFGVAATEAFNRAAIANTSGTPGRLGTADDFADDIWQVDNMGKYFKSFAGHNDPRLTDRFFVFDFDRLRDRAIELTGRPDWYTAPSQYSQDLRTTEKTRSAYMQWRNTYDVGMVPVNVAAGVRYEKTEVDSPALVSPPAGNLIWERATELRVNQGAPVTGTFTGEYDYWLPSFDVRADLRDDLVLRASYSKSIGRAGWRDIQGGLTIIERYPILGGLGNQGNPGLLPLESKNLDLSLEWYYGDGSYVSVGYFKKDLKNFIGTEQIRQSPYQVTSPIGGRYWMNAINSGISDSDLDGIRAYIFANHANDPGVDAVNEIITGQPGDPVAFFDIATPTNQRSDKLDGLEINVQHMFGESGFGVSANYTKVDSGLHYDNLQLGAQFPMIGLSDSANLVLFYDKHDWQVRAAYNWRDEFLSSTGGTAGTAINPNYTESYGQLDVNVTWQATEKLSVFVEAINLTDETQRIYNRHKYMLFSASQTGPRYMFGARYKF